MIKNVNSLDEYLIHLLACALNDCMPQEKPDGFTWAELLNEAKRHEVANTVCYALAKIGSKPDPEVWREWTDIRDKSIVRDVMQKTAFKEITDIFNENGIRYIPLKGLLIKEFYPRTDMRTMADLDILIDEENAEHVRDLLTRAGYICEYFGESHHDIYKKYPIINIEIHRKLLPDRVEQAYEHYRDAFIIARPSSAEGMEFELSAEEFYAYIIAHLYKHYAGGGSGIRSVMDIHQILKHYSGSGTHSRDEECVQMFDDNRLRQILDEIGLIEFEQEMRELSDYWFGDGIPSERTLANAAYISGSGTYGNYSNLINNQVTEQGIVKHLITRTFLPLSSMKKLYPILTKLPVLLPICWIMRIFNALIVKNRTVRFQIKEAFKAARKKKY